MLHYSTSNFPMPELLYWSKLYCHNGAHALNSACDVYFMNKIGCVEKQLYWTASILVTEGGQEHKHQLNDEYLVEIWYFNENCGWSVPGIGKKKKHQKKPSTIWRVVKYSIRIKIEYAQPIHEIIAVLFAIHLRSIHVNCSLFHGFLLRDGGFHW